MLRKKIVSIAAAACLTALALPIPASATTADMIREYMNTESVSTVENGQTAETPTPEPDAETPQGDESVTTITEGPREEQALTDDAVNAISDRIADVLDGGQKDEETIRALQEEIAALPLAGRLRVKRLAEFQALTGESTPAKDESTASGNQNKADRETMVTAHEYTLTLQEGESATLVIRFTEDADKDGRNDIPDITVTAPDGSVSEIHGVMPKGMEGDITETEAFLQFDISSAAPGNWTFAASGAVLFNRMDYQGAAAVLVEEEEITIEDPEDPSPEPKQNAQGSMIVPVLILAACVAAAFLLPKLLVRPGRKEAKKKETEEARATLADAARRKRAEEEEEIRKLRAEMEESRRAAEEMDRENARRIKEEEEARLASASPDDAFLMTRQDVDNDGALELEEYEEFGTGFLSMENGGNTVRKHGRFD